VAEVKEPGAILQFINWRKEQEAFVTKKLMQVHTAMFLEVPDSISAFLRDQAVVMDLLTFGEIKHGYTTGDIRARGFNSFEQLKNAINQLRRVWVRDVEITMKKISHVYVEITFKAR
jgi:hypothetical protein